MKIVFVAGSGTDVGKTYVAVRHMKSLQATGRTVIALKPVATGCPPLSDPGFLATDTARLVAAQGLQLSIEAADACSPWRFAAPLSPDMAATKEGRRLALREIIAFLRKTVAAAPPHACIVVEGVGGVMSPICEDALNRDLIAALGCPTILVAGSYLGAITHALTALEALKNCGARVTRLIVNESESASIELEATARAIGRFAPDVPVEFLRRLTPDGAPSAP